MEHASTAMVSETGVILNDVRKEFKLITHSLDQGLVDVLPPRRLGQQNTTIPEIASALKIARGEIRIIGFSLREFLDGGQPLCNTLMSLLNNDEEVTVMTLLIDPTTDAARMRAIAEQGAEIEYRAGELYNDDVASIRSLQALMRAARRKERFKVEARFYNFHPTFYMIGTPDTVFIEPYHLGRKVNDPPCIGGFVPLFRFTPTSEMHQRAYIHFDYIWHSLERAERLSSQEPENQGNRGDGKFLRVRTIGQVVDALEGVELSLQRGVEMLSQQYRERLEKERKLDQRAEDVMAELKQIREEIAANEYQT